MLSGVLTMHTGFPLTIKVSGDPSGTGARSFRANVVGTPNNSHLIGPGVSYLDLSAYGVPAPFTFGNSGPGVVRGPGETRLDFALAKDFLLTERKYFELRGRSLRGDQYADLREPGVADHYVGAVWTDPQRAGRTGHAGGRQVLFLSHPGKQEERSFGISPFHSAAFA